MKLFQEILFTALNNQKVELVFPNVKESITDIINNKSYESLQKIKEIIDDDSLSDEACFQKIEKIVCVFEDIGASRGNRHSRS